MHANRVLGEKAFHIHEWEVIGEYVYDGEGGRHEAYYSPLCDSEFRGIEFKAGERIKVEQSLKYSADAAKTLWHSAGLKELCKWTSTTENYSTSCFSLFLLLIEIPSK